MKFLSFSLPLLLLLLTSSCHISEALFGSKKPKTDQEIAKEHTLKAAEDARLSAKYARDAAAETLEAAKAQGRAFTGGVSQKARDYYDSAGNVIGSVSDYVGTVYDSAGNALGHPVDFVYDSAGNVLGTIRDYIGSAYDSAGNAIGGATDFAFGTASSYYDKAGNLIGNIGDYVGTVYDKAGNALGDAKDFAFGSGKTHRHYYDSKGGVIGNLRNYAGIVYDCAGNALGDAKDFAFEQAHDYYDSAGNIIGNMRGYVGTVYDKAGNALGDAKDFVYQKAANVGSASGMRRAGNMFHSREDKPCRRLVGDSCACVKSLFPSFSTLLTLAALLVASYFIYTRLLGKRIDTEGMRRQSIQLGDTIKAKADIAREKVNGLSDTIMTKAGEAKDKVAELGQKTKETIASKVPRLNGRVASGDQDEMVQTHEHTEKTDRVPVQVYNVEEKRTVVGPSTRTGEMMEGEDGVLFPKK